MKFGIDRCLDESPAVLTGARFGVLMNQASVCNGHHLSCDILAERFPDQLVSIFSPQHGIFGEQQANMIETGHSVYAPLGVPVHSLYSETRRPTEAMLVDIDCLIIDLQDVGTRVYTFIWTMLECLRACAEARKQVLVLDRPNPIGGEVFEGPMLDANHRSFVGGLEIPLRHGLTMAELARLFVREFNLDVELSWLAMEGWQRSMWFEDTGRRWIWPSPNVPTLTTAGFYPGQVLLEGTCLSEGRGTTRPFELVGAPFADPHDWVRELGRFEFPGVDIRPVRFTPTFDKWAGISCGGMQLIATRPRDVRSVAITTSVIATAANLYRDEFKWLDPPYEYEMNKPPIDILFGNSELRSLIGQATSQSLSADGIAKVLEWDEGMWRSRIEDSLLYA